MISAPPGRPFQSFLTPPGHGFRLRREGAADGGNMWRYAFVGLFVAGMATQAPALMQRYLEEGGETGAMPQPVAAAPQAQAPRRESFNPLEGRVARIESDARGHFLVRARMNGTAVTVMVDTGATLVAMNETTARRIGIRLKPGDFRHAVRTANGTAPAASATIDEIEIGRVIVRDVPAAVLRDGSLDGVLLGMSFLGKLRKFGVEAGTLVLNQ